MKRLLAVGLVILLGFLQGILGLALLDKPPQPFERVNWSLNAQWIGGNEPSYRLYARQNLNINEPIQSGWLRLSADNDFIVYVNGKIIAREVSVTDNGKGFTEQLSEQSQRFYSNRRHLLLPPSRVFRTNQRDWLLTTYIDLSSYLTSGVNVIAVEVQKSRQTPRVVIEGNISLASGHLIDLTTGLSDWKVSSLGENFQKTYWFESRFYDQNWRSARALGSVTEKTYSRVNRHLFERPMTGYWITGSESPQGEVWLRQTWQLPSKAGRAFLRIAGDGEYALLINGILVKSYPPYTKEQVHLFEVTHLIHAGVNIVGVRLARPLELTNETLKPLQLLLDGWTETGEGKIKNLIATDSFWNTLNEPSYDWFSKTEVSKHATIVRPPISQTLHLIYEGDAVTQDTVNFVWHLGLWSLGGIGLTLAFALCLGQCWNFSTDFWKNLQTGASLLFPSTFFLVGVELLKIRYLQTENGLWFYQEKSNQLIFFIYLSILLTTLLASCFQRKNLSSYHLIFSRPKGLIISLLLLFTLIIGIEVWQKEITYFLISYLILSIGLLLITFVPHQNFISRIISDRGAWAVLFVIVLIGFLLRVHGLDETALHADETVSWDAAKGILSTGKPILSSGILYTRSPFFHYTLALWLRIWGDSLFNARLISIFWGAASLIMIYVLGYKLTRKRHISLIIVAILAFDSWSIMESRFIRYYQSGQFLTILCLWLVLKGFVDPSNRKYQFLSYLFMTLMVLNQEINLTLLPCFFLGFLLFYQPFKLKNDWSIIAGYTFVIFIFACDIMIYNIFCLTPNPALSTNTDSVTKLHFYNILDFFSIFFSGVNQSNIIYSFLFIIGLFCSLKEKNTKFLYVYSLVLIDLGITTILVMQIGFRYTYSIYSIFILLSINTVFIVVQNLVYTLPYSINFQSYFYQFCIIFLSIVLLLNLEPIRVFEGYKEPVFSQTDRMFKYISSHYESEDLVITSSPAGGAVYLKKIDYFLPLQLPFPFDVFYWKNGSLIDRWVGGKILSSLDSMEDILRRANRIWILLDDNSSKNDSEMTNYFKTLGNPIQESFGNKLRLWQKKDAILHRTAPNRSSDLGSY